MLKSGEIIRTARNAYMVPDGAEKRIYRPIYSVLASKLILQIAEKYPSIQFILSLHAYEIVGSAEGFDDTFGQTYRIGVGGKTATLMMHVSYDGAEKHMDQLLPSFS